MFVSRFHRAIKALTAVCFVLVSTVSFAQLQYAPGRILVQFKPGTTSGARLAALQSVSARGTKSVGSSRTELIQLSSNGQEARLALALSRNPAVEFAEVDGKMPHSEFTPNDPYYASYQYGLFQISANQAWDTTRGSSSIIIAVLDSGIDTDHPDLKDQIVAGWNTYDNNGNFEDVNGHGTIVAGVIAATGNNGIGVASVAMNCRIMPIRISDSNGWAYWSDLAEGLTWAADHGARVANASYDCTSSSTVQSAARYFQQSGGVFVAAAGNGGAFQSVPDNPYIVTVSAVDSNDNIYSWSNTGDYIDISAPGTAWTTSRGGSYVMASGTSVATPYVAGVAALILSNDPSLSGSSVQRILKSGAKDLGASGWDSTYGAGRLDAYSSIQLTGSSTGGDSEAPSLSFNLPNSSEVSGTVTLAVSASDNVAVVSVEFYIDGNLHTSLDSAPYECTWDTTSFDDGSHTVTVYARDAADNVSSKSRTFTVSNSSPPIGADNQAPEVSILSPGDGSKVSNRITVTLSTSDNVAVTLTEIYVDGVRVAKSKRAKTTFRIDAKRWSKGAHTIMAFAKDAAGNGTWSAVVTVQK